MKPRNSGVAARGTQEGRQGMRLFIRCHEHNSQQSLKHYGTEQVYSCATTPAIIFALLVSALSTACGFRDLKGHLFNT
jgi:hypothetical protein